MLIGDREPCITDPIVWRHNSWSIWLRSLSLLEASSCQRGYMIVRCMHSVRSRFGAMPPVLSIWT